MPKFSQKSIDILATCHQDLQVLCLRVIQHLDFTVICGYRTPEEQIKALQEGRSKVGPEFSKHCKTPSRAIDIAPYPVDWSKPDRFYYLAGWIMGTARAMGLNIRYGGDWDMDGEINDNTFDDLCHFELV